MFRQTCLWLPQSKVNGQKGNDTKYRTSALDMIYKVAELLKVHAQFSDVPIEIEGDKGVKKVAHGMPLFNTPRKESPPHERWSTPSCDPLEIRFMPWSCIFLVVSFVWRSAVTSRETLRQNPLEAILVIFGRRALIFFCLKALGKIWKWHHFCAHAQWWSPWRRKNVEKGHLAPSNLTFLLIAIDRNGFRRMKEEELIYKTLPQIF